MATSLIVCAPRDAGSGIHIFNSLVPAGMPETVATYVASTDFDRVDAARARSARQASVFFMSVSGGVAMGRRGEDKIRETVRLRRGFVADRDDDVDVARRMRRSDDGERDGVEHIERRRNAADRDARAQCRGEAGAGDRDLLAA